MPVTSRVLLLAIAVALVSACSGPGAPALPSVAPAHGVTVENPTGERVDLVYEHPNDDIDEITVLDAGATVVVGTVFEGRDALCVNGRLIARDASGAEVDELYFVCRGKTWTIEP
jgi:hypothetical protein